MGRVMIFYCLVKMMIDGVECQLSNFIRFVVEHSSANPKVPGWILGPV